jgi:hypothetical protein
MCHLNVESSVLLSASAIALSLRFLQKRFPKKDPLFIERLIISSSAGLFLLIVTNKLIADPSLAPLSIPFAIAAFVVSVFNPGYGTVKILPKYQTIASLTAWGIVAFVSGIQYGFAGVLVVIPVLFMFPRASQVVS